MKIFWLSVSPVAATGYGRITREVVSRLLDRHEVICLAHEADVIVWGGRKVYELPRGKKVTTLVFMNPMVNKKVCLEILTSYISMYRPDLIIAHWDAMALDFLNDLGFPFIEYIPVDGRLTEKWVSYTRYALRVITYSRFGYEEFLKWLPPSKVAYIPHGIDTNLYRPLNTPKEELRAWLNEYVEPPIPEDSFLYLYVAANIGPRKLIPLLMRTFRKLASLYDDVHLLIWTNSYGQLGRAYDLLFYRHMLKLDKRVHFPKFNPILSALSEEDMVKLYNSADVYVSNSVAEGFGLPIIEALACGLPVIAPKNSSQVELVSGCGWLVDNVDPESYVEIPIYVPYLTEYPVPDQKDLLRKMIEAYEDERLRKYYSKKAREKALEYDWDKEIMPKWFKLLEELEDELNIIRSIR